MEHLVDTTIGQAPYSETANKPRLADPPPSSTDLKFDLLANQLKINVVDSDSSISSVIEVVEDETSTVAPATHYRHSPVSPTIKEQVRTPPKLSPKPVVKEQDERVRKIELLRIFQELEQKGIRVSTKYSIHSSLHEMEQEYDIIKSLETKKQAVNLYKGFMVNGIQLIEFLNESYNPFDFQLRGWAEQVSLHSEDYTDVLGEIYEKYKYTGRKIEPELKLVVMLLMSATTFHTSKTFLKGFSGGGDKQNYKQQPDPAPVMKGPDPRAFLDNLKRNKPNVAPRVVEPVIVQEPSSTSTSDVSITTTTTRKKKPMIINL